MAEPPKLEALAEAEALLRSVTSGVLSTLSARAEGWPFGSIVPYAVSKTGEPLILIASIAEHTKNIGFDPRVSLLVAEKAEGGDVQAKGRLTVMGYARLVSADDRRDAEARYLARVPEAIGYSSTHDFAYYAISLERLRYIGGFGKIFWLEPKELPALSDALADSRDGVISHMNKDHGDALLACAQAMYGLRPERIEMVGVDSWGMDVECGAPDRRLRFEFDEPAGPDSIRRIVVALTTRARKKLAGEALPS